MLDESLVFHKTQAGANEIATPVHALPPKLRRALIMVDGAKSVAELSAMFRPGEAAAILLELQAKGLVSLSGGEVAKAAEAPAAPDSAAGLPRERFEEIRREAMREISHRLGPNGDALALKIERCATPQELRVALREAEKILASFLGAEYGRTFAQKVGRDLL
ncbi:MAG TPA: hypothetical protein PLO00_11005 [Usitatibacteraceae bacterium]|jgi:hypothetical protein|nr:hypothetical protein [Usitatibacteraceae bacterium]HQY45781.1 hypothetical protein [Usitatibacteraceae bacterium]